MEDGAHIYEMERVSGGGQRVGGGGTGNLEAQMPGQVVQVLVAEGDQVEESQPLLILEAMKMEIRVTAPHNGVVAKLMVKQGESVDRGQQLVEITKVEK